MVVPTTVRHSSPIRKSRQAKTERGRIWGSASMTKMGTVRKSHVTAPHNASPTDPKIISFFFCDASMCFIESLFQKKYQSANLICCSSGVVCRPTRRKKGAARRNLTAPCLKLALAVPQFIGMVERTFEAGLELILGTKSAVIQLAK